MPTLYNPRWLAWVYLSCLSLVSVNSAADFSLGVAAYNQGDYAKAAVEFLIAAEKGDTRAQLNLGLLYDQGQGVEQDHTLAAKWYTRAADNGDDVAQTNLAAMYFQGLGIEQDDEAAAGWYQKAARSGNAMAQYNLSVLYAEGIEVETDLVASYVWLEIATANGAEVSDAERAALSDQLSEAQQQNAQALIDVYHAENREPGEDN